MTHLPAAAAIPPPPDLRTTRWLTCEARSDLAETIIDLTQRTVTLPHVSVALDNILTELGVAEARDQMWPDRAHVVRQAHGLPADALPVRFTATELELAAGLATLPEYLADLLHCN